MSWPPRILGGHLQFALFTFAVWVVALINTFVIIDCLTVGFKGIDMVKSWPGPGQNIIYCTRQLRRILFHCVAKETMDLWTFLWPVYSDYEIYLCLFPLKQTTDDILPRREGYKSILRRSTIPSLDPISDSFGSKHISTQCLLSAFRFFRVDKKQDIFNDL